MTIPFSEAVKDNSFWTENGVIPGDVIKTVDGKALTLQNANEILTEVFMWKPGREVDVRIDRKGEEIVVKTTLTQSYTMGSKLTVDENATEKQNALRTAWLKG
ncbi:hypothetical protein N7U66_02265 [Lacinutrix neustonica]|uniref:PDZ domain-containing protein n=1 Tax=Lacinutrix neustonica TaxID=2980107 RepID=A0A9E8MVW7_9FLAO|nr:hypothetical protein [Lacinutrix neustonica]WAC02548.1 hypothetical protein N7U66_02265 [Lacinutrix neustonica]